MGPQKVKSKVIQSNLNPVWNEHLQLCINGLNDNLMINVYLFKKKKEKEKENGKKKEKRKMKMKREKRKRKQLKSCLE